MISAAWRMLMLMYRELSPPNELIIFMLKDYQIEFTRDNISILGNERKQDEHQERKDYAEFECYVHRQLSE